MERLGQQDLFGQMLRIERTEAVQLLNHFLRDSLRRAVVRPAVHHTMPNGGKCIPSATILNPIHKNGHRYLVIRRSHGPGEVVCLGQPFRTERGIRQSNPLNRALQNPLERVAGLE